MVRCAICGKKIQLSSRHVHTADDEYLCENCMYDYTTRCEECNEFIVIRDGVHRCKRCEEKIYESVCNSYSTKPVPQFKNSTGINGKEYPKRYYGIEMEFNNTDSEELHDIGFELYKDKWIYNKHDGSIDDGVEVVTSPMDRKSVNILLEKMKPMFEHIKDSGDDYEDNAGIHIHVTKKSIAVQDRYKLCILLNGRKTQLEKNIMYLLSGRAWRPMGESEKINDGYYAIGLSSGLRAELRGHRVALNTQNRTTYEFRIFKSSIDKDVILSYVEMVDTMIDFCHNNGIKDITVSNYIKYLKDNTKNKVLLSKIEMFEGNIGKVISVRPIILSDEKIQLLKGIKWIDYYKVLYRISRKGYTDFRNIKHIISDIGNVRDFKMPKDDLSKRLEKTLRMCLIAQIKKEEREIKQCA